MNFKKLLRAAATAYTLYKANQEEADAAFRYIKRKVKAKNKRG